MDFEKFSIEHFSRRVVGLNLNEIRAIAEEINTNIQFSDRLFKDKYIVAAQGLSFVLVDENPTPIGPVFLTAYLIDISNGNIQKIFEESETEYSVVGVDVSFDKQTILIMTIFDDFPKVVFIGEKNFLDIDCGDLIDMPVNEDTGNPRWSADDKDTIVFYNCGFDKFSSIKIDWDKKKAFYIF